VGERGHPITDAVGPLRRQRGAIDLRNSGKKPLLFLSHSAVDTEAALALASRIEQTGSAREAGLKVWIDKRDLAPGRGWQSQLEHVIVQQSTAFAVLLGARGAVNWVESELRVALDRATRQSDYSFIPILGSKAKPEDLPPFARQYHGVSDPLGQPGEMRKLLSLLLEGTATHRTRVVEHPFVGLSSFTQTTAELFHGRCEETEDLLARLRRTNMIMVVGDSGSGKSSLVRAGVVPRFRGGAFADTGGDQPDSSFWQVIETRPESQPFERLVEAVNLAAQDAGIPLRERGTLSDWVRSRDPAKMLDAIRNSAQAPTRTLLVVDQFEELWTQTKEDERKAFVNVLLDVADLAGLAVRIVLTMRRDYYNLCAQFPALFQRIEAVPDATKFQVRRMSNAALRRAVIEPLKLTDAWDEVRIAEFSSHLLQDVGDRPGDLALVEMALAEAWRYRRQHDGDLLRAYIARGRVAGALANAAEDVFRERLRESVSLDTIKGIFVRLVRLGDTGGTTRRIARRSEFTDETWSIVQRLAQEDHARLVSITGATGREATELAHEALVTQWARYQGWLEDAASDKRHLDHLIEDASAWSDHAEDLRMLAREHDLAVYRQLMHSRASWLSITEKRFVITSIETESAEKRRIAETEARILEANERLRAEAEARASAETSARIAAQQAAEAANARAQAEQEAREAAQTASQEATERVRIEQLAREAAEAARRKLRTRLRQVSLAALVAASALGAAGNGKLRSPRPRKPRLSSQKPIKPLRPVFGATSFLGSISHRVA
jgi:energy-coupling factor transporter ATP-binding protein EcfA2